VRKSALSLHRRERARQATVVLMFFVITFAVAAKKDSPAARKNRMVYAPLTNAPGKAVNKRNPLAGDPDAVPAGRKLFEEHCAECHGHAAEGSKRGPSLRVPEVRRATPGALFWILSNGVVRYGMPDWSKLPEPERWQIVTFIKSLASRRSNPGAPAHNRQTRF
jgi:mono/diheme cytochrome c family protein